MNRWLLIFILSSFLFQVLLVPQSLFAIRTPLRIAAFGISLLMLVVIRAPGRKLPVTNMAIGIIGILVLGLLHPETNSLIAGFASIGLQLAIIAPVFWVSRLRLTKSDLKSVLFLFWMFHAVSSAIGILEVYQPARFGRRANIAEQVLGSADMAEGINRVTLADGTQIMRPMGLTDSYGGASRSGYYVIILGSILLLLPGPFGLRSAFAASILGGLFCIYITQVRSALIIASVAEVVILGALVYRHQLGRFTLLLGILATIGVSGTVWGLSKGGEQTLARFQSLVNDDPSKVYYQNRGIFLTSTLGELIPEYPLGAGLGRWGMINLYFGQGDYGTSSIWVEIQPTAWLLDGGLPLLVLYYLTLLTCIATALYYYLYAASDDRLLPLAVLASNIGFAAQTFSYVTFISQSGLDFWVLNSCLMVILVDHTKVICLRRTNELKHMDKRTAARLNRALAL